MEWKKLAEEEFPVGRRRVLKRTFRMPDGRVEEFFVKLESCPCAILALTPERNVVLVRQYRPGPERLLLELPGGRMEPGETPLAAAQRELLEETGYTGTLRFVGETLDCGYSTMRRHNFAATDCRKVQEPTPDDNEFLEVVELTLPQFRDHLRSGQLSDIESGYLGLDFLGLL